jgi:hypothetical protein
MIGIQKDKFMSRNLFIIRTSSFHHYKRKFTIFFFCLLPTLPIPMAALSKVWVGGRSLSGIAGSNLARGIDVCLLGMLYFVR